MAGRQITFAAAGILVLTAVSAHAQSLKLVLEKGRAYRQITTRTGNTESSAQNATQTAEQEITTAIAWHVKEVEPSGNMRVTIETEWWTAKQTLPFGNVSFDSRNGGTIPAGLHVHAALASVAPSVTVDRTGRIVTIHNADELRRELAKRSPTLGADHEAAFTDDTLKRHIGSPPVILPAKPMRPGQEWTGTRELSELAGPDADHTFTLQNLTDDRFTVSVSARLDDRGAGGNEPKASGGGLKLKGRLAGQFVLDRESGWILSGEETFVAEGVMTLAVPGVEKPIQIPTKVKTVRRVQPAEDNSQ